MIEVQSQRHHLTSKWQQSTSEHKIGDQFDVPVSSSGLTNLMDKIVLKSDHGVSFYII